MVVFTHLLVKTLQTLIGIRMKEKHITVSILRI